MRFSQSYKLKIESVTKGRSSLFRYRNHKSKGIDIIIPKFRQINPCALSYFSSNGNRQICIFPVTIKPGTIVYTINNHKLVEDKVNYIKYSPQHDFYNVRVGRIIIDYRCKLFKTKENAIKALRKDIESFEKETLEEYKSNIRFWKGVRDRKLATIKKAKAEIEI